MTKKRAKRKTPPRSKGGSSGGSSSGGGLMMGMRKSVKRITGTSQEPEKAKGKLKPLDIALWVLVAGLLAFLLLRYLM